MHCFGVLQMMNQLDQQDVVADHGNSIRVMAQAEPVTTVSDPLCFSE